MPGRRAAHVAQSNERVSLERRIYNQVQARERLEKRSNKLRVRYARYSNDSCTNNNVRPYLS